MVHGGVPPPTEADVIAATDALYAAERAYHEAQQTFKDVLVRWETRPVVMRFLINGVKADKPMNIPDDKPFTIHVVFEDKFNDVVVEPGATTFVVSDPALASVAADPANPGDDTYAVGNVLAGSGTFTVSADSGLLEGTSEPLVITPGTATQAQVQINMAPKASHGARAHK